MFENDYIMRLIHEMVRAFLRFLFHIDTQSELEQALEEDKNCEDKTGEIWKLLQDNRINEAENLLYDYLDVTRPETLKTALLFYESLNTLDDKELARADYTRQEIEDGVRSVLKQFGYGDLIETLLKE